MIIRKGVLMKAHYQWIFLVVLALLTSEWTPLVLASAGTGAGSGGGVSGAGGSAPLAAVSVGQTAEGGWHWPPCLMICG
jgi:hypothetical protein